eukprot:6449672-Amphidinium_carterae.1
MTLGFEGADLSPRIAVTTIPSPGQAQCDTKMYVHEEVAVDCRVDILQPSTMLVSPWTVCSAARLLAEH